MDAGGIEGDVCKRYPNAGEKDAEQWKMSLDFAISNAGQVYRKKIDEDMAEINRGTGFGKYCMASVTNIHLH